MADTDNGDRQVAYTRQERQERLRQTIQDDPFLTDEELASRFSVSVQTIRLDRLALSIPEVRERMRAVAENALARVRSVGSREIVGELVDLELGERGISILQTIGDMAFERTQQVCNQYIFAQADSLALAIVDSSRALTHLANAKFKQPVRVGSRLVAKAEVLRRRRDTYVVLVQTRASNEVVFRGKFVVVGIEEERD